MRAVDPQKKVCKKSAKSLHFMKKSLQKVCKKFPRRRLCRLMQTFEKVCTSLPPDASLGGRALRAPSPRVGPARGRADAQRLPPDDRDEHAALAQQHAHEALRLAEGEQNIPSHHQFLESHIAAPFFSSLPRNILLLFSLL
jgi:hypothetical protein